MDGKGKRGFRRGSPGGAEPVVGSEKKLEKLSSELDSVSSNKESTSLPNLKYAKSKYQNVESLLNYVEKGDDQGGLKLVIMNFND